MSLSRILGYGGLFLLIAGIVLAVAGDSVVGFGVAAVGCVALTSFAFLLVGESEDRDRERDRER